MKKENTLVAESRQLTFEVIGTLLKNKPSGIYRIQFGTMYYIGKSKQMRLRFASHKSKINQQLAVGMVLDPAYTTIINYLLQHPEIKTGAIEVLEYCEPSLLSDKEVVYVEAQLNQFNCLNSRLR